MSGRRSRNKGAEAEREIGRLIDAAGFTGSKRMGRNGYSAEDIDHTIPGVWIEAKRQEKLSIPSWLRQAEEGCGNLTPVVVFRQSRQPWRAVVPLDWLLSLLAEKHIKTEEQ